MAHRVKPKYLFNQSLPNLACHILFQPQILLFLPLRIVTSSQPMSKRGLFSKAQPREAQLISCSTGSPQHPKHCPHHYSKTPLPSLSIISIFHVLSYNAISNTHTLHLLLHSLWKGSRSGSSFVLLPPPPLHAPPILHPTVSYLLGGVQ